MPWLWETHHKSTNDCLWLKGSSGQATLVAPGEWHLDLYPAEQLTDLLSFCFEVAGRRGIHLLDKSFEDAAAFVELGMALFTDKLGQSRVPPRHHPNQPLKIGEEDLVQALLLFGALACHRDLPKSIAQASRGKLPMAKPAVPCAPQSAESYMDCSGQKEVSGAQAWPWKVSECLGQTLFYYVLHLNA